MLAIILPLASGLIAQAIKFFVKTNNQKFHWRNTLAYSGMPSGHSAMMISLAMIILLQYGFGSPLFAISVVLAIVVIRDALGIRRYLGDHGKTLNVLVKDLKEDEFLDEKYPKLLEKIGHTPAQVIVGSAIGLIVSVIGYLCF